ncbi:hypothetical protein [Phytopseudomonas flavescens]|uniref:hypothetical protein n=1 Tax=Phytopseudomonas flavescens TaxID=29435 RepID=UPI0011141E88|nr:hypothetical protein [Pseudomonas flavescens]
MATQVWQLEKVADYSGHAAPRTAAPGRWLFPAASGASKRFSLAVFLTASVTGLVATIPRTSPIGHDAHREGTAFRVDGSKAAISH